MKKHTKHLDAYVKSQIQTQLKKDWLKSQYALRILYLPR